MNRKKEEKKKRSSLPTQLGLIFRTVAGAYLMYLAYSIYTSSGSIEGGEKIAFTAAIIVFVIVGAIIVFSSLRALQRGEYEGGAGDHTKEDEEKKEEKEEKKEEVSGNGRIRFGEPETIRKKEEEE